MDSDTNKVVVATGTYNSSCDCRARRTMRAGDVAPPCPTCRKPTKWSIVVPDIVTKAHPAKAPPKPPG